MDIPGDLIIIGVIIVAIACFFAVGVDNTIPMYNRSQLDDICSSYLAVIERDSGLTTAQKNQLTTELNAIGITDVIVTAPVPSIGNWGTKGRLTVNGKLSYTATNPTNYTKDTQIIDVKYDMTTVILALPN